MRGAWKEAGAKQVVDDHRPRARSILADPNVVSVPEAAELLGSARTSPTT